MIVQKRLFSFQSYCLFQHRYFHKPLVVQNGLQFRTFILHLSFGSSSGYHCLYFKCGSNTLCLSNIQNVVVYRRFLSSRCNKQKSLSQHYDVLGVSPKAAPEAIKSAYYKKSKVYHPDVSKDPESHKLFTEISDAYEVLGNPEKKQEYDDVLNRNSGARSGNPGCIFLPQAPGGGIFYTETLKPSPVQCLILLTFSRKLE